MGFLGFLKKKKDAGKKGGPSFDMPPIQSKIDSGKEELPSFADDKILDDLKLPDIDDLNQPNKTTPPEMPPPKPFGASKGMGEIPKHEMGMPDKKKSQEKPKGRIKFGEMKKKPEFKIGPGLQKRPQLFGKKQEKMPGSGKMMPEAQSEYGRADADDKLNSDPLIYGQKIVSKDGEFFIKGDDYREVLEALDSIIARRKEAEEKVERDRAAEKFYNQFEVMVEKLQKKLATAEIVIFEQKR